MQLWKPYPHRGLYLLLVAYVKGRVDSMSPSFTPSLRVESWSSLCRRPSMSKISTMRIRRNKIKSFVLFNYSYRKNYLSLKIKIRIRIGKKKSSALNQSISYQSNQRWTLMMINRFTSCRHPPHPRRTHPPPRRWRPGTAGTRRQDRSCWTRPQ